METLRHIMIAAVYTVLAIAVAATLPLSAADVSPELAVAYGALVLVFGAVLHEAFSRYRGERAVARRFDEIRKVQSEILELLQRHQADRQERESVAAEVRLLHALVERLLGRQGDSAATGQASAPAAATETAPQPASKPKRGPSGAPRPLSEQRLLETVRAAVGSDRIEVYLQPIVSLPQRKPRLYECFTRITTPEGEVLKPDDYVAVAERAGIIDSIDNMLLFRAVQLIKETQRKNVALTFFCNLSTHTVADETFMADFAGFIEANPQLAGHLVFEVGQADLLNADDAMVDSFRRLTQLGFSLSMDQVTDLKFDLKPLHRMGVRYIKVPADVLLAELRRPSLDIDVRDLKATLDGWHIDLVIERIEQEDTLRELLDLNIDYGQGYLFGEPRLSRYG